MSKSTHQSPEVEDNNIRIVRQLLEAANTGDVSRAHEFIGPEYFNRESQADPTRAKLRGPDEFIASVKLLRSAFADLHFEEQDIIASRDRVAAILTMSGIHIGNYAGISPTGRTFSYPQVHICRIADSKVVEHRAVRDDLKLMIQLGVIGPASPQYDHVFQSWKSSAMR